MKIVSVEQMKRIENSADANGLSYEQMMHNAGQGIADWVNQYFPRCNGVIGLIGSGNNGGDTLIALKRLSEFGFRTLAILVKNRDGDPLVSDFLQTGGVVVDFCENRNFWQLKSVLFPGTIILDGILGTGLKLPIRGQLLESMHIIKNELMDSRNIHTIAIDCPSGIDCDTGEASEAVLQANVTLCMAAVKQGLLKPPASLSTGDINIIDIGIANLSDHTADNLLEMIDAKMIKSLFPKRTNSGHKGTFGTCLVIGGSTSYIGAPYLTGKAAYLSGCGLVEVATKPEVQRAISGKLIEAVWTILPGNDQGYDMSGIELLLEKLQNAESLIIGPGLSVSATNRDFLMALLQKIPKSLPTLIDAGGLKLLAQMENWWQRLPRQTILTPHPGELSALTGLRIDEIQSNRWRIAQKYALGWGVTLLLKGAISIIALPDQSLFINPVSDSALSTAGSGDVLSGIIGGLLAQGMNPKDATLLGNWVHSKTGRICRARRGSEISVTALDILDAIGESFVLTSETP